MKELTIQEKAKAYDEAIERAKAMIKVANNREETYNSVITIFPELKESEDEGIRKAIIKFLIDVNNGAYRKSELEIASWIAWLEKQGEQKETLCDKCRKEQPSHSCQDIAELGRCAVECEQKSADKVEPKFKVGDWITDNKALLYVTKFEVDYGYELKAIDGKVFHFGSPDLVEEYYRLWTIQDAKEGDVLASNRSIFIFSQEYIAGKPEAHCGIMNGLFLVKPESCWTNEKCYPATKEQRDTLEKAMADAGYTFDFDKKELKGVEHTCELDNSYACVTFPFMAKVKSSGKIVTIYDGQLSQDGKEWIKYQSDAEDRYKIYEPNNLELVCEIDYNPAWSEEDEKIYNRICDIVHSAAFSNCEVDEDGKEHGEYAKMTELLKSLKDRVHPQPKQWSEEDDAIYDGIIKTELYMLDVVNGIKKFDVGNESIKEECTRELNWLRSFYNDLIKNYRNYENKEI